MLCHLIYSPEDKKGKNSEIRTNTPLNNQVTDQPVMEEPTQMQVPKLLDSFQVSESSFTDPLDLQLDM